MKEFIVAVWEVRKQKLYGDDSYPGQLQRQSSAGDWGPVAGVGGRVGKSGKCDISHGKGEAHCTRPPNLERMSTVRQELKLLYEQNNSS